MKTVHKYQLRLSDGPQPISMPMRAQLLSAQIQCGQICLWALVETAHASEVRSFIVAGTGDPIAEERLHHVETVQMDGGHLVWHIFEVLTWS